MPDPIPLVGLVLLAFVLAVSVLCALTPTPQPPPVKRRVSSNRKAAHR